MSEPVNKKEKAPAIYQDSDAAPILIEVESDGAVVQSPDGVMLPAAGSGDAAECSGPANSYNINDYDLINTIGSGGMGVVYKAKHKNIDKTMAIKCLHKELAADPVNVQRFAQEVKAASLLTHPNLVSVYDSGISDDGTPYLVMDFLDGTSLADVLQKQGFLPLARFLDIFIQTAEALEHAHNKNIVHRDLKPSNIMILNEEKRGEDFVKIVDFGIARVFQQIAKDGPKVTQTGDVIGSPIYMSPEQCLGLALDKRSDIYSMGIAMYECLTGAPPFGGDNAIQTIVKHVNEKPMSPSKLRSDMDIPEALEHLIMSCLEKDPQLRPESVHEVLLELRRIREDSYGNRKRKAPLAKRARTAVRRGMKKVGRNKAIAAFVSVCILAGATAGGFWLYANQRQANATVQTEQLLDRAEEAIASNHFATAMDLWRQALTLAETNNMPLYKRANMHLKMANAAKDEASKFDVRDHSYKMWMTSAFRHYLHFSSMHQTYPKELGPVPHTVLDDMAFAAGQIGRDGDKIHTLQRSIDMQKEEVKNRLAAASSMDLFSAYAALGQTLESNQRLDEAQEKLEEGIALAKQLYGEGASDAAFELYLEIAGLYERMGEYEKAIDANKELLKLSSLGGSERMAQISELYKKMGRHKEAAQWKSKAATTAAEEAAKKAKGPARKGES